MCLVCTQGGGRQPYIVIGFGAKLCAKTHIYQLPQAALVHCHQRTSRHALRHHSPIDCCDDVSRKNFPISAAFAKIMLISTISRNGEDTGKNKSAECVRTSFCHFTWRHYFSVRSASLLHLSIVFPRSMMLPDSSASNIKKIPPQAFRLGFGNGKPVIICTFAWITWNSINRQTDQVSRVPLEEIVIPCTTHTPSVTPSSPASRQKIAGSSDVCLHVYVSASVRSSLPVCMLEPRL
jgi:hypothetical protein